MDPASERLAGIAFGRFQVSPDRRDVLADGRPVKLGGRAFDVLMALIEARGAVVSKEALMARVWPGRTIEENSLAAQIAALRAALGPERELIRTVSGRGYQFTGEIRILSASPDKVGAGVATAQPSSVLPPTNTPKPVSELIGREEELSEILNLVTRHRLVTLTGTGGIGKTSLALALARELRPHFADGVWLAEFSALADPRLVPATVAAVVGLELGSGEASAQRVAQALADRRLLLVLDTCEHVIAAAATMAEAMLGASSAPHIIATSREPLRAGGEWVYPVQPLAVPAVDVATDDDPLRYGAVRLFVERARAAEPHFAPDRRLMTMTAAICRRLDGIPLAIELAAARAAALGIEALAARLHDRFRLLTGGRRTALPRHQALRATLDWSYELLAEPERAILRRLAVFAGPFSLEAAAAVTASPELAPSDVIEGLSSLVAKSLVAVEVEGGAVARYRLLDTTRAYALEKVGESGEMQAVARRHAEYYCNLFERAKTEWEAPLTTEWLADSGRQIDNVRTALDWAFSRAGDITIGVALTAAYAPVWMHLSLNAECRERALHALECIGPESKLPARRRTELYFTFGMALSYTDGLVESTETALAKALDIAESVDDVDLQLQALWGMFTYRVNNGRQQEALSLAERFSRVARRTGDPADLLVGDRFTGGVLHYLGNQPEARRYLERVVDLYVAPSDRRHTICFVYDQRLLARSRLARVLWLQGFVDEAKRTAQASLEDARAAGHQVVVCTVLSEVLCPIELMTGDLAAAERSVSTLIDVATRHRLPVWESWGSCLKGELLINRGEFVTGLAVLRNALAILSRMGFTVRYVEFLTVMAQGLGGAGQLTEALATIDEALAQTDRDGQRWCVAESLRVKGELLLKGSDGQSVAAAEDCFFAALDAAREQGALFWELRAATSLARLWRDQGRPAAGVAMLQPVYGRFTQGFETADLKAAKALLGALAEPNAPRTSIA
jgi:predicted ATPase/DNA-binding winged helix-turn-helix (wHTH) protein